MFSIIIKYMKKKVTKKIVSSVCANCAGKGRVNPKSHIACEVCNGTGLNK